MGSVKMIDGSEKRNRRLAFEFQNSHVCEKRSKEKKQICKHRTTVKEVQKISAENQPS